jgi:TonB family protein
MPETLAAIVAWSVQAACLVAGTAIALGCARVRDPRLRLAVWHLTAVLAATAPFVLGGLAVTHPPSAPAFRFEALAGGPRAGAGSASEFAGPVVALLAGVAAARVLLLLAAWSRVRRSAERASPLSSPVFEAACRELGVHARLVETDSRSPYAFGRRSPVVAVDPSLLADDRTARAVFLHELAHVARGDWSWVVLEELVCRLLWFHPGAWFVAREMRAAREEIVDRLAAERLGSRRAYLDTLLALGERAGPVPRLAPALVTRHQLARRVRALALEGPMSRLHAASAVALVALTLAGAAYAGAAAAPVRPVATASAAADEVENPVPTKKVDAVYPEEAKQKRVEGEVALDVTIGADGLVKNAVVKKSIPELDAAALAAIKQWEFRPGRVNGKPVQVVVTLTFSFRLE